MTYCGRAKREAMVRGKRVVERLRVIISSRRSIETIKGAWRVGGAKKQKTVEENISMTERTRQ